MTNIRDIARMANVSVTTVSRVINKHPYVSEEKREAVLKVMEEADYQVNLTAVHLSQGKSHLIGVVVPFANHPYFGLLIEGIAKKAVESNYHFVLIQTNYDKEREQEALNMLKHKQVDGLIICSRILELGTITEYRQYGKIVVCENADGNNAIDSVYVDHYQSFLSALEYLYEKGYRNIGYSIGRDTGSNSYFRQQAYRDFLKQKEIPYHESFVFTENYNLEDGQKVVDLILQLSVKPDALLVTSDVVAAGIITACNHTNLRVPEDLAVIGFDDQPIAKMMGITTFEMPIVTMGERLFQQVIGTTSASHQQLNVTLIERNTV
ncbi:LacI family DNA-binding transcriptional regulator [Gracilibacillus kekensis]|uniref:Transcriptional regulator, LacI family n=1 Tax=Gracilibacillus kekensis TaxID=1027249 RepID=A0A1M7Q850_9BACI|nr:LacI family DNA-binding transcriptional regulator [Gracilibacillus kekensis]SHN26608.1 transcriptional regulator, LacI family [Gracilibacillus kekensis]